MGGSIFAKNQRARSINKTQGHGLNIMKNLSFSVAIASILFVLLSCLFPILSNGMETSMETTTLRASTSIPELGISEGEYYDIIVYNGGDRVVFQNLTNTIVCIRSGAQSSGHLDVRSGAYINVAYTINNTYGAYLDFYFSGKRVSNSVPENPRQVTIRMGRTSCNFR